MLARHHVGADDGGGADLDLLLDHQLAGDAARDDGGPRMDLALPARFGRHAEHAGHFAVAADASADDERSGGFQVAGQPATLGHESRGSPDLIDQSAPR